MSFAALGLSPSTVDLLLRLGYETPTPVQASAIPPALDGRDVLARAETGTGKTAAFGLPMIERLAASRPSRRPRGVILVPTRELALQVQQTVRRFAEGTPLRLLVLVGGEAIGKQTRDLRRGVDVVVATPGRLIDHLERRSLDLGAIEVVTLDEADRMLDMGFLPPLTRIMQSVPAARQTLLLSATLSADVVSIAKAFTTDPVRIDVAPERVVASTVVHRVYPVPQEQKRQVLASVLAAEPGRQTLVFCKTKHGSDRVGKFLEGQGLRVAVIHGDKTQGARKRALHDFKTTRASVLVATDVAARGLDIERLPLVVNYDLPLVAQDYVHRVGRTGRAGHAGEAISLVTPGERRLLRDIQALLPSPIEQVAIPGLTMTTPAGEPRPAAPRLERHRGPGGHDPRRPHGRATRPRRGPHGPGPRRPQGRPSTAGW